MMNFNPRTLLTALTLSASAFGIMAQTPETIGIATKSGTLVDGQALFLEHTKQLTVEYSAPVEKTYWSLLQNGNEVLSGIGTGSASPQQYSTLNFNKDLTDAMTNGTVACGDVTLKISKIEYEGGQEANDVASISLNLTDAPAINMFYPGKKEPPMELKETAALYIYFAGAKVTECSTLITQNDATLGNLKYYGNGTSSNVSVDKNVVPEIIKDLNIAPGIIEIRPMSVTYISPIDGQTKTFNASESDYPSVRYEYKGEGGKVVSETEFKDNTILSWYAPDSEEGTKTVVFSKPIQPGARAALEYGNAEVEGNYAHINVPMTLSDDGTTIVLDLRGKLRNVATMVPNAHFTDDYGNPVPPPTTISLAVTGLMATDNTPIVGVATNPYTGESVTLTGQIFYTYNYLDLTFDTPKIKSVDLADGIATVKLENYSQLVSATLILSDGVTALATYENVVPTAGKISVDLPEGFNPEFVTTVMLNNPVYKAEDGADHSIRPYSLSGVVTAPEVSTIAEMKDMAAGTSLIFNTSDTKVTFNQAGYVFIEDATGGLIAASPEGEVLTQGTIVSGQLYGTYQGNNTFVLNQAMSQYTLTPTTIVAPELTIEEALVPIKRFCVVRLSASDELSIAYDADMNMVMLEGIDGSFIVGVVDFLDPTTIPDEIESVSGIMYMTPGDPVPMIIITEMAGKTNVIETVTVTSVAELKAQPDGTDLIFTTAGTKVSFNRAGYVFIEDATGGLIAATPGGEALTEGMIISGELYGTYQGDNIFTLDQELSKYTLTPTTIEAPELSIEEALMPEKTYCMVQLTTSEALTIAYDEDTDLIMIGAADGTFVVGVTNFIDTTALPAVIESVSGIMYVTPGDPVPMILITEVTGKTSGIETLTSDSVEADVYNITGVKMRTAGQSLQGLAPGVYVIGNKKVLVK